MTESVVALNTTPVVTPSDALGVGGPSGVGAGPALVEMLAVEDHWGEDEPDTDALPKPVKRTGRPKAASRAARPVAIAQSDLAVVEFLGRYGQATYTQMAGALRRSKSALRHRLPRLERQGLVRSTTVGKTKGRSGHAVWLATEDGLRLAGVDLPTPTFSWGTAAHTLGLVDIGIRFEALGETVVTEREIRAANTRGYQRRINGDEDPETAPLYVVRLGKSEGQYCHIPDMVLARPRAADGTAQSVAIELELNHKPATQWRKILSAYKKADHIGAVVYYTASTKVRNGITDAAKQVGAEQLVIVRRFELSP